MPGPVLLDVVHRMKPRPTRAGDEICRAGEEAHSCFFPVAGKLDVHIPGRERKRELRNGEIFGEFGLCIPKIGRTATVKAEDDGLLLEIKHDDFRDILKKHEEAQNMVHLIIRSRIVEDVWCSSDLFPGLAAHKDGNFSDLQAECVTLERNHTLDLANDIYVLLTGRVRVGGARGTPIDVQGGGRFDQLAVAGIESAIGDPDGGRADVLQTGAAVRISRETVRKLQNDLDHSRIKRAWLALAGQHLEQMRFSVAAVSAQAG